MMEIIETHTDDCLQSFPRDVFGRCPASLCTAGRPQLIQGKLFISKATSSLGDFPAARETGRKKRPVGPVSWQVAVDVLGDGAFPKNEKTPHRSQKEDPTTNISALG